MKKIKEVLDYYCNIIFIVLFIFLLTGIGVLLYRSISKENYSLKYNLKNNVETLAIKDESENAEISKNIKVDIKGAVKKPGVYEIEENKNVSDLIKLAGGLEKNATTSNINLSRLLESQMVIKIFTKNEIKNKNIKEISECVCNNVEISKCDNTSSSIIKIDGESSSYQIDTSNNNVQKETKKISINTASKEDLMTLNSIGESKANAIIEYRNNNGLFESIDEIKNVSGIGDSLYEKIRNDITI